MLAIAESSGGMVGFRVGLQGEGGELDLAVNSQISFSLRSAGPHRQLKIHSSQPLFLSAPGPVGFSRVAVSTWPIDLLLQEALLCLYLTTWPWLKQNPLLIHFRLTEVCRCMVRWLMVSFWVSNRLVHRLRYRRCCSVLQSREGRI